MSLKNQMSLQSQSINVSFQHWKLLPTTLTLEELLENASASRGKFCPTKRTPTMEVGSLKPPIDALHIKSSTSNSCTQGALQHNTLSQHRISCPNRILAQFSAYIHLHYSNNGLPTKPSEGCQPIECEITLTSWKRSTQSKQTLFIQDEDWNILIDRKASLEELGNDSHLDATSAERSKLHKRSSERERERNVVNFDSGFDCQTQWGMPFTAKDMGKQEAPSVAEITEQFTQALNGVACLSFSKNWGPCASWRFTLQLHAGPALHDMRNSGAPTC